MLFRSLYSRRSAGSGLHFAADLGGGLLVQSAAWFRTIQGLGCEQLSDVGGSFFALNPVVRPQVAGFLEYAKEHGAILYFYFVCTA